MAKLNHLKLLCGSFEASLRLPSLPEMIFDKNVLRIEHEGGFGLEFNTKDALARVDPDHDTVKVANAQEWAEARCGFMARVAKCKSCSVVWEY